MLFALLTLLSALSLAATAGWFSIAGFMAIYAGAPMYALIMGIVAEAAKLVTTSWLYRNWQFADWKLKTPLIYFTLALMLATSIGVYGFLSKAHLEQGAGTLDNSSKIESLQYQIDREKTIIADNEKVITQLDGTVNSLLGKDRADRSLSVRKSQAPQRKQLRDDIAASQKRIDELSSEKFKLDSEVRKLQLEVGPIRYIAELFYGADGNTNKNIESAVRMFTLLLVSILDPLAVILLIAANHTLMRLRNEKDKETNTSGQRGQNIQDGSDGERASSDQVGNTVDFEDVQSSTESQMEDDLLGHDVEVSETTIPDEILSAPVQIDEEENTAQKISELDNVQVFDKRSEETQTAIEAPAATYPDTEISKTQDKIDEIKEDHLEKFLGEIRMAPISFASSPSITSVGENRPIDTSGTLESSIQEEHSLALVVEPSPHFIPQKLNEEETKTPSEEIKQAKDEKGVFTWPRIPGTAIPEITPSWTPSPSSSQMEEIHQVSPTDNQTQSHSTGDIEGNIITGGAPSRGKYSSLSWIKVFKGTKNE